MMVETASADVDEIFLVSLDSLLRGSRVVCGGIGHHDVFL